MLIMVLDSSSNISKKNNRLNSCLKQSSTAKPKKGLTISFGDASGGINQKEEKDQERKAARPQVIRLVATRGRRTVVDKTKCNQEQEEERINQQEHKNTTANMYQFLRRPSAPPRGTTKSFLVTAAGTTLMVVLGLCGAFLFYFCQNVARNPPPLFLKSNQGFHHYHLSEELREQSQIWNMDWCLQTNNGEQLDLSEASSHHALCTSKDTVTVTIPNSFSSMTELLQILQTRALESQSARCVLVLAPSISAISTSQPSSEQGQQTALAARLATYFTPATMLRVGIERDSFGMLRGVSISPPLAGQSVQEGGPSAPGNHDMLEDPMYNTAANDDAQSSFLLHLWQARHYVHTALCERLPPVRDFTALYLSKDESISSAMVSLNKKPKEHSEHVFLLSVEQDEEDDHNTTTASAGLCREQLAALRMLQGASRTFWSSCDDSQDYSTNGEQQENTDMPEVVNFLLELYASTRAKYVIFA